MKKLFAENVVIGSGAGGSTVFHHLSSLARDCLMVEEGSAFNSADLRKPAPEIFSKYYRYGGIQPVLGNAAFPFGEGRVLGGTTELNGGLLWRTPSGIIEDWRTLGIFADVDDTAISESFSEIERLLSVGNVSDEPMYDKPSTLLERGATKNQRIVVKAPRAGGHLCERSNRCAVGCPTGAKQSMSRSLIPLGVANGGQILSGKRAVELIESNRRIQKVIVVDTHTGEKTEISGKDFFLCAGPIQSPLLISNSGGPHSFPIQFHLNAKVLVRFEEDVSANASTLFTRQVQSFMGDGIIYMAAAFSDEFMGLELAGYSDGQIQGLLQNKNHLALYTVQIRTSRAGRLTRFGSHPFLYQKLVELDISRLRKGLQSLSEDLFAAGAKEVWLPTRPRMCATDIQDVDRILSRTSAKDYDLSSVHAMASLPLSVNPSGLFDEEGKSRNYPNLWSMDASSLPSSIGESPQGTIMALAKLNLSRRS